MLKKSLQFLAIGTVVFVVGCFSQVGLAQAAESIPEYTTDITLNPDSNMRVVEKITYDFGDVERHGIFRDIRYKYKARGGTFKLRIDDFIVRDENNNVVPFETSTSGGEIRLKIGDPDRTVTGMHSYEISYSVRRAVNYFDDHDELYWNAIGSGWDVPIAKAITILHAPAAVTKMACYTGTDGSTEQACSIEGGNTEHVTFRTTRTLDPTEGFTIVAALPVGTLTPPTAGQKFWDTFLDNGILLLPLFVFVIMFWLWKRYGKDPKRKNVVVAQYDAPNKLSALYVGALTHNKVTNADIAAEVVYLAANGYLTIKRLKTTKMVLFKGTDYEFTKTPKSPDTLAPQTKALLDELFPGGVSTNKLSDLKKDIVFGKALLKIKSEVNKELVKSGYYKINPGLAQGVWLMTGLIGGVFLAIMLGNIIGYLGAIAAALSGLIVIGFSFIMPARTQKGAEAAAHIEGLEKYLTVA
jgi:hypothetical protein